MVPIVSQKESKVIVCVLVSGKWQRIHFIKRFRLVFERLPLEKEKLLEDRISRIREYKSLSFWDRLLSFDPIFQFPPAEKREKKRKNPKKKDPRKKYFCAQERLC